MTDTLRVLIIDDEPIIVRGLENLFDWRNNGFELAGKAFNGEEGLTVAKKLEPDIILTDIRMPKLTGLELISSLKPDMPELEFIIISGYDEFSYCQEALRLGAFDYILKPVNYQQLGEKLAQVRNKIFARKEDEKKKEKLNELAMEGLLIKQTEFFRSLIHKTFSSIDSRVKS